MKAPPGELREFLYAYAPAVQSLALGLRSIVHEELAPCHEYIFAMHSKVVLLYGATERVIADGICSIGVFPRHVTLTFTHGVDLPDPDGLLQGTGKGMRHLRLKALADLDRPEVRTFLRRARSRAGLRRRTGRTAGEVVTRVKPRSASRRGSAWPPGFGWSP